MFKKMKSYVAFHFLAFGGWLLLQQLYQTFHIGPAGGFYAIFIFILTFALLGLGYIIWLIQYILKKNITNKFLIENRVYSVFALLGFTGYIVWISFFLMVVIHA